MPEFQLRLLPQVRILRVLNQATGFDSQCHQPRTLCRLESWRPTCEDSHLTLCCAQGFLSEMSNLATVSITTRRPSITSSFGVDGISLMSSLIRVDVIPGCLFPTSQRSEDRKRDRWFLDALPTARNSAPLHTGLAGAQRG